ncbi:AI-2E family transporter [Fischerella thermalis]|uniref:AI-2E family transporter n=1 Tax=Fischerella thermalis CCMEE 5268 TaxID=2019662 RepID=A0A2N6KEC9_9CYAN|nr:AI-2E family transporter [Fischerella thermalis]PMB16356.1 AI-2E family transporter [Fischerella thermalis CCMEE 5319]PMB44859.1 AI-2E family transporter [Fischerella thermalis CCMEE 5205]PLZ06181.1 AI-2E family transporter [Fischerella thermalis WC1110]PLZ13137.1 AI-2E family transporter [Fischerella thermalis WC119]PLZ36915.1 AI-2E family transporter [Fischerella thermalis WC538]
MRRWASVQNLLIYGLGGPIIALNVWLLSLLFSYFQHPITIFSIATILAFLLNYPVKFFERARISRAQAVIIVLLLTLTLLVILGVTLVPMVIEQTNQLLDKIPDWLISSQDNLEQLQIWAKKRRLPLNFSVINQQINANIQILVQQIPSGAVGFAGTLLSGVLNVVLVVVLAFYMLLYGDRVWYALVNLLPSQIRVPFTTSLRLNFQNFFLIQLLLGLFMVVSLTPIFLILKVPFALVFAIFIGVSELIPFVGATLGIGTVTILLLLQNWWLAMQVAIAAIVMQQVKDNLLGPKLLGDFIGINPIWIFVSILMGFEIAGFLGSLLAVPIAGTIKGTLDAMNSTKIRKND